LRAYLLVERPLWFDETFTLWASRLSLRALVDALRLDSGPPGFYLLERPLALLAGASGFAAAWLRVPSLLASLALFAAAASLPRGRARVVLVLLLAGSALINLYAAEARVYALLSLACLALFLAALRGEESAGRLAACAAVAAGALYLHYLAILAVGAIVLLAAASRRLHSALAVAAGACALLPWIPLMRAQPREATAWLSESALGSIAGFLSSLGGVGRVPAPFGAAPPRALTLLAALVGALLALYVAAASRRDRDARLALAYTGAVLLAALALDAWRPLAFPGRTEMAVLPVWLWGVARVSDGSEGVWRLARAAAALGLAATFFVALSAHPASASAQAAEGLARSVRDGDTVVASAGLYLPLRLAADRGELHGTLTALPPELAAHPGWFVPALPGPAEEEAVARAASSLPRGGRLFLAVPPPYATAGILRALESRPGRTRLLSRGQDAVVILRTPGESPPPASP
jgi:hypothetical protein